MFKTNIIPRLLTACSGLLLASAASAASTFSITGISDEQLVENLYYSSPTPVVAGTVSGTLFYSFDPFSIADFCGRSLLYWGVRLLGEDSALFTLDSGTGVISLEPKDYENPTSNGLNSNADNIYTVTLFAVDEAGSCDFVQLNVEIIDQPALTFSLSGIGNRSINENAAYSSPPPNVSGSTVGPLNYSLAGADAALFAVNSSTGSVSTNGFDFENPADSDRDNRYEITLVAMDGDNNTATLSWVITVLDLPPLLFSVPDINASINEHSTYISMAPSISGSFRNPLQYSLSGDDAELFTVNQKGIVSLSPRNFENPADTNGDNIYEAVLNATDNDGNTASSNIRISILDIPFDPDFDNDGDGVINMVEVAEITDPENASSFRDYDRDGIPDALDGDADNDLLANSEDNLGRDPYADNDNDFIPDYLDADDRGDGNAASCTDLDNNGICDLDAPLDPAFDTDQDGRPNHADIDSDNDSIPDIIEMANDFDLDGRPNHVDIDSDNDGIPDLVESGTFGIYSNPDGIADRFYIGITGGVDLNGDLISDSATARDSDNDGAPDYLDRDADNDGIPDALEGSAGMDSDADGIDNLYDVSLTGGMDANRDGIDDSLPAPDTDGDSTPDYLDTDSDNDSISDTVEARVSGIDSNANGIDDLFDASIVVGSDGNGDGVHEDKFTDSDNDSAFDHLDLDSDNDGITDIDESGSADSDRNGLKDTAALASLPLPDADADGIPDYLELDSDADGVPDIFASGMAAFDTDSDGRIDITGDPDRDGIDNSVDSAPSLFGLQGIIIPDTDGDGIKDNLDGDIDGDGISNQREGNTDNDGDGVPNYLDLDSDNDGISDFVEAGAPARSSDSNGNGIDDSIDVLLTGGLDGDGDGVDDLYQPRDSDHDSIPDFLDADSDNDLYGDRLESSGLALSGLDSDSDGIDDAFDVDITGGTDTNQDGIADSLFVLRDHDLDGVADYLDADSDNDQIADVLEGIVDTDGDGIPNRYDRDSDNDGLSDYVESGAPLRSGDSNANGIDDSIDVLLTGGSDADSDGIDDAFPPVDSDGDGIPDYLDPDSDNDLVSDNEETSGIIPLGSDSDADGIDDAYDVDISGGSDTNNDGVDDALVVIIDTDKDGTSNHLDIDSDNDGFADGAENEDLNRDNIPDRLQVDGKVKSTSGSGSSGLALTSLLVLLLLRRQGLRLATLAALLASFTAFADNNGGVVIDEKDKVCRTYTMLPSSETHFASCFYLGAGLGNSKLAPDTSASSWQVADDKDSAFALYGGYHFNRQWFAEISYHDLGQAMLDNRYALVTDKENIGYQAFSLMAGYYLPIEQWLDKTLPVNFFIKAGPGLLASDSSGNRLRLEQERHTLLATGAGIEWQFHKNWMLRGELNTFSADVTYTGLSLARWFGGQPRLYKLVEPEPVEKIVPAETVAAAPEQEPAQETASVQAEIVATPIVAAIDSDNDGIMDDHDSCPATPANTRVDIHGCATYKGYIQSLYGAFNSTDLTYTSYGALDTIILLLKNYPDTRIAVQAHTDDRGTSEFNQRLSELRADVVKQYLVEKGIAAARIETAGFGESKPLGNNETAEGRSKNRRIDFVILNQKPVP